MTVSLFKLYFKYFLINLTKFIQDKLNLTFTFTCNISEIIDKMIIFSGWLYIEGYLF